MRIFCTTHAMIRMKERVKMGYGENPIKVMEAAYKSNQEIPRMFKDSKHNMAALGFTTYQYRYHRRRIWVFQTRPEGNIALITIYSLK